jgi:hypothetical protein
MSKPKDQKPEGPKRPVSDYKVGYGRPPKHTRFKPGQSGNSKGRPKGRKNNRNIVREIAERQVTFLENGRRRTMSVREALFQILILGALKPEAKINDQYRVVELLEKYLPELDTEGATTTRFTFRFDRPNDTKPEDEEDP